VLYDSSQAGEAASLPDLLTIKRIELSFPGGAQHLAALPADLALLIYIGDLSAPSARVGLLDLLRQGGVRPLNLSRRSGEAVQIVLADPQGKWAEGAPAVSVSLFW
jgi:Ca-activated chloride channel homolog